jgi:hypothetical protein
MSPGKITRQGSDARADVGIKQEMLTERLACIKPVLRDGITKAW